MLHGKIAVYKPIVLCFIDFVYVQGDHPVADPKPGHFLKPIPTMEVLEGAC